MPEVILGDAPGQLTDHQVDKTTYHRLLNEVGEGTRARLLEQTSPHQSSKTHTMVWDCVEQAWAGPFPNPRVYDQYLTKQVVICSACNYMSTREDGSIRNHVQTVMTQGKAHAGISLSEPITENGATYRICLGCDTRFHGSAGQEHLTRIQQAPLSHGYVEALLINKFALAQSEPTVFGREVITDGPVTSQVATNTPPRKRRRRRRGKHGNSD